MRTLPPDRRYHCPRCGVLVLDSDLGEHEGHGSRRGVSDEELATPSCLVTPRDNKKSQAVRSITMIEHAHSHCLVFDLAILFLGLISAISMLRADTVKVFTHFVRWNTKV